jgi:hypothetical protein
MMEINFQGKLARSQSCNLAMRLWGRKKLPTRAQDWLIRLYVRNGCLIAAASFL